MKRVLGILMVLILLSAGLVFADTNGVWDRAQDIRGGTFGSDEQDVTTNYTFMNPVYLMDKLLSYSNTSYFLNFSGRSQLNEVGLNNLDVNYAKVHNNLNVTTSSGRAIWAKSTNNDAVAGETTASGKSAIYGWAAAPNAYSGYFEGGQFYTRSYPITLADIHFKNCGKLYTDANGNVTCGSETDPQVGQTTNGDVCYGTGTQTTCNNNNLYWDSSNQRLGIGTSSPQATLDVNGNVRANAFLYYSDKRLKTNISTLNNSLYIIKHIRGVKFNWKNSGKKDIGVIAQEIAPYIPEAVHKGNNNYEMVDYVKLIPVLLNALKSQENEIDNLSSEIKNLNENITILKNEIKKNN